MIQYEVTYITNGDEYSPSLETVLRACAKNDAEVVSLIFRGYDEGKAEYTLVTKTMRQNRRCDVGHEFVSDALICQKCSFDIT